MSIAPYWTSRCGRHVLYNADCLEVLPGLEAGSIDAAITDPPYGVGIAHWDGDMPPQALLDNLMRVATGTVAWFGAATRVLDFGQYTPRPDRLLVWNPSFALGRCQSKGFVYSWHPIALWRPQQCGAFSLDVLRHSADGHNWWNHPGTKPIELMSTLCQMLAASSVLDPFTGSGTTGVACIRTGRRFIGIEISREYCDIAVKRMERELSQPKLPGMEPERITQLSLLEAV